MNNPNLTNLAVTPPSPTIFRTSEPTGEITNKTKQSAVSRKGDFDIKPTTTALIGTTTPNIAPQDATKVTKGYMPQVYKLGVAKKSIDAKAQSYTRQDAKAAVRDTASLLLGGNNNAVAGILGNVDKESKFNSGAINPNDAGQGKDSFGLFQHNKDRLTNLKAYADKQGKSYNNPEVQTEFALQEAKQIKIRKHDIPYYSKFNDEYSPLVERYKGMSLYDALKDPYITKEEAATLWVGYFERPANLSNEAKIRSANAAKFYAGGSLKKKKYDIGGIISLATAGSQAIGNTMDLFNSQENPNIGMSIASGAMKNPLFAPLGAIQGGVQAYRQKQAYGMQLDKLGLNNFNQGKEDYANSLAGMSTARGFYAKGGDTNSYDYEVEDKEVVQGTGVDLEGGKGKELASDMTVVEGELHEEGGVQGSGGERVFSDRIKPSSSLVKVVTKLGFKVKEDDTYATLATKFGKLKGIMEDKNKTSTGHISRNTAMSMLPKLNMLIEATYQDQEATKEGGENTARIFAMGGKLPKFPLGGGLTSYGNSMNVPMTLGTKLPFPTFNGQVALGNPTQGIKGVGIASSPNSVAGQMDFGDLGSMGAGGQGNMQQALSTLTPSLLSGFGYLNDMLANAKLRMPKSPNLLSLLPNTYTDRSQLARNRNEASARSMMAQVSPNSIGERQAMFSHLLNANNDLQQNENQRRDTYEQGLTAQNAGVKAANVQSINVYNQDYTDAQNQKTANAQKAGNAFITNMTTGIRENNQRNLDLAKMGLIMDSRMIGREGMKMSIAERTKRLKDAGMSDAQIVKLLGDNSTN